MFSANSGSCSVCGRTSKLFCQRCIETYCSIECQIIDWPQHKFICAPMPKLVPIQTLNTAQVKPIPNSISNVSELIFINSTNKIRDRSVAKNITPLRQPYLNSSKNQSLNNTLSSDKNLDTSSFLELNKTTDYAKTITKQDKPDYSGKISDYDKRKNEKNQIILGNKENYSLEPMKKTDPNEINLYNEKNLFVKPSRISHESNFLNSRPHFFSEKKKSVTERPKIMENPALKSNYGKLELNFKPEIVFELKPLRAKTDNIVAGINIGLNKEDNSLVDNGSSSFRKSLWKTVLPMPKKEFFDVIVQHYDINAKLAWVTDVRLLEKQTKLLQKINLESNSMTSILKTDDIHLGNLYGVTYSDGIFYRAVCVEEINPLNEVKVRLLDYGNNFFVNYQELKYPTPIMENINALTFCIRYPDQVEIGKVLKICIDIKEFDPIFGNVYLIEEDNDGVQVKPNDVALPQRSILKMLPSNFKIRVLNSIEENCRNNVFIEIQDHNKAEFEKMSKILNSEQTLQFDFCYEPKKGNFVAARNGETWSRAIILDKLADKYLVFLADAPEINFVEQVKRLPKEYQELPLQTAIMQVDKPLIDETKFYNVIFRCLSILDIKNYNATSFQGVSNACDLYDQDVKIANCMVQHFDGNFAEVMKNNIWLIQLANHDIVRITAVVNYYTVYVAYDSIYVHIKNELNLIGKLTEEELKIKSHEYSEKCIVLVKKEAQEYVRCRILKISSTNEYEVFDLDSGSVFQTKLENLLPANDYVKYMPVATTKIILKTLECINIANSPIFCLKKLNNFVKENVKFKLRIESAIEDGVILKFCSNDKESLNYYLIPFLFKDTEGHQDFNIVTPDETVKTSSVKCHNKKYYIKDIEVIPIPIGKNVQILTLDNSFLNQGFITGCIKDMEFLEKLIGVYQDDIDKFCADPSNGIEYLPEYDEVCLALFDDHWYRAFCLKIKNDEINVMFVDYGNTEWTTKNKIRKFDEKFLHKALANTCFIEGVPKSPNLEKLKELTSKIFVPNAIFNADEVEVTGDFEYLIHLNGVKEHFA